MNAGRSVFSQLMDFLPLAEFRRCVERYRGDYRVQSFSCLDQFLSLAFAQLTYRESLRDIEACLRAMQPRLYHMGFRGNVSRNNLANANQQRDWRIYADFAQLLISEARSLYAHDEFGVELAETVYALDSTTIDLCLSLFPWAPWERSKAAVKMHTLLDVRGSIPSFIHITPARVHDVAALDEIVLEPGAFYIMDRGYIHFARLYRFTLAASFFVVRARGNMRYRRRYSHVVDKTTGLRSDQTIILTGQDSAHDYPAPARRVHYFDGENQRQLAFLTNNFAVPALTIAELYRSRWAVELFFKWIKQHLRIKRFYGTSENAVKTQIWIAMSVYLLVAILKKRLGVEASLYRILQILSVTAFEKVPILQAIEASEAPLLIDAPSNQLNLFD
ncbi:MAG: IS4 family transposase [Bryobacteraceae bacterium]